MAKRFKQNINKNKQVISIYNKIANFYDEEYENTSALIDDFLDLVIKNGKILDVGCGTGLDTKHMSSRGFNVLGIDASKGMIGVAKKNFPEGNFKVIDIRELELKNNFFDGIFVAFSIIHSPKSEIDKILDKLYKSLKKDGIIYFAVQEGKSKEGFILSPYQKNQKIFLNVFSSKEVGSLIKKAGFVFIKDFKRKSRKNEFPYNKYFVIAKK